MKDTEKSKIWNVPNMLTMLRLVLIPVYVVVFRVGTKKQALFIFLLASLTDLLDGRIARKFNLITDFGKVADPIADKLMVTTVLLSQVISGVLPAAPVILVIFKEALLLLGGAIFLKKGYVIPSAMAGKIAQVMFIASLFFSFFHQFFIEKGFRFDVILLWISVVLSYMALGYYVKNALTLIKQGKEENVFSKPGSTI